MSALFLVLLVLAVGIVIAAIWTVLDDRPLCSIGWHTWGPWGRPERVTMVDSLLAYEYATSVQRRVCTCCQMDTWRRA